MAESEKMHGHGTLWVSESEKNMESQRKLAETAPPALPKGDFYPAGIIE